MPAEGYVGNAAMSRLFFSLKDKRQHAALGQKTMKLLLFLLSFLYFTFYARQSIVKVRVGIRAAVRDESSKRQSLQNGESRTTIGDRGTEITAA